MAYQSRGNAYFETGDYWDAFADHTDGLGVRYLGDQSLAVTARLGEVRLQLAYLTLLVHPLFPFFAQRRSLRPKVRSTSKKLGTSSFLD